MTDDMREKIANHVAANQEETELETLVEVLGDHKAQVAVASHTLPELIAAEQGHGLDFRNVA